MFCCSGDCGMYAIKHVEHLMVGLKLTPSSTTIWSYLDKNGLLTCGIKMFVLEFFFCICISICISM